MVTYMVREEVMVVSKQVHIGEKENAIASIAASSSTSIVRMHGRCGHCTGSR